MSKSVADHAEGERTLAKIKLNVSQVVRRLLMLFWKVLQTLRVVFQPAQGAHLSKVKTNLSKSSAFHELTLKR